jgi:hypothetical protein
VIDVSIVDRPRAPSAEVKSLGVAHTAGVAARRSLSEIRDNLLTRYPRLLAAATGLATRMKVTGKGDWEE